MDKKNTVIIYSLFILYALIISLVGILLMWDISVREKEIELERELTNDCNYPGYHLRPVDDKVILIDEHLMIYAEDLPKFIKDEEERRNNPEGTNP